MTASNRQWCTGVAVAVLAGCAGNGEGLDASGRPLPPGGGGTETLVPTLESIQANVFSPICTQCHVGASAPAGLRLDTVSSYGALVGVPSSEVPGLLRVKPGDPGSSYLMQKLEGRASVGARMPLGQSALPASTLQVIRQWIADGAPRAASTDARLSVQVVSASAGTIAVGLSRPVDAALVNAGTVLLERIDSAQPSLLIDASASVSPHNDTVIVVLPRAALTSGVYRLTLRGAGPAALADWNGNLLDGDGNQVAGGDYQSLLEIGGDK